MKHTVHLRILSTQNAFDSCWHYESVVLGIHCDQIVSLKSTTTRVKICAYIECPSRSLELPKMGSVGTLEKRLFWLDC